jgi:hypothetical protein
MSTCEGWKLTLATALPHRQDAFVSPTQQQASQPRRGDEATRGNSLSAFC